jgi:hypothetical protein
VFAGCAASSAPESTGTVALKATISGRTLSSARAVAVASDGSRYWAALTPSGQFTLKVPAGKSYRVLLVNSLTGGGSRVSGHVVTSASGRWLALSGQQGTVDLGTVSPSMPTTLTTKNGEALGGSSSEAEGKSSGEGAHDGHDADPETHDGEHEDEKSACADHDGVDKEGDVSDDDDVDLHPSKDPGSATKDDKEKEHDDAEAKDGEDDDEQERKCGGDGKGAEPAPAPPAPAPAVSPHG